MLLINYKTFCTQKCSLRLAGTGAKGPCKHLSDGQTYLYNENSANIQKKELFDIFH